MVPIRAKKIKKIPARYFFQFESKRLETCNGFIVLESLFTNKMVVFSLGFFIFSRLN